MGAAAIGHWIGWVIAWTIQSMFVLTAIAGQHEAIHGNLFKARWANHVAGQFWAAILLFPYGLYRASHLQHHVATHTLMATLSHSSSTPGLVNTSC